MSGIEMTVVISSIRLLTRIYEKVLHTQSSYKCTWIFWVGTIILERPTLKTQNLFCISPHETTMCEHMSGFVKIGQYVYF